MRGFGRLIERTLLATTAMTAIAASANVAFAGGFAVREQSTSAQGSSYAGNAAGYDLSSQFWNPAALGSHQGGFKSESHAALLIPNATIETLPGTTLGSGQTVDTGMLALVPSSYSGYRVSKDLVVGHAFNAPFGLTTKPDNRNWAGQFHARTSEMKTYNLNVNAAYQIAPGFYLGAGVQAELIDLTLKSAAGLNGPSVVLSGDDIAFGYTAGLFWQPSIWTSIGLGYRSKLSHDIEGDVTTPLAVLDVSAKATLPEMATLSIRQGISNSTRLLGTIEWTNWSRLQNVDVLATGGALVNRLAFNWHDGWFFAGGLEHDVNKQLTVRTGLAFEQSPVQNPNERSPRIADNDRWWASLGLTYHLSQNMSFDLAYSHVFVKDGEIDRTESGFRLVAEAKADLDIISASVKMRWGGAPQHAPMK